MTTHRKFDRVFLPFNNKPNKNFIKDVRSKLLNLCRFLLGLGGELPTDQSKADIVTYLFEEDAAYSDFIVYLLDDIYPVGLRQCVCKFCILLLRDRPVSSIISFRKVAIVRDIVNSLTNDFSNLSDLDAHQITPMLKSMIEEARHSDYFLTICNFVLYLCDFVSSIHEQDQPTPEAVAIPETYDPESGVAYYFTDHGNQVRNLPRFSINKKDQQEEVPNKKTSDGEICEKRADCRKDYTKTSDQGWSHLFLWFCPIHGHCYGFHIIKGSEGRKDAFASAYKYMPEAPEEIYYDNTCSLFDYCFNRAPFFFRNSRFWFDIFHSVNHKCGHNHKCHDIAGLLHQNTSICEQFNSSLKNLLALIYHNPDFVFLCR